jgi:hypothetical protein
MPQLKGNLPPLTHESPSRVEGPMCRMWRFTVFSGWATISKALKCMVVFSLGDSEHRGLDRITGLE